MIFCDNGKWMEFMESMFWNGITMNNLTTSPVAQYLYEHAGPSLQILYIGKGCYTITQKNMTDFDALITDMNLTDWLSTSDSDASITDKLNKTVQIDHGTRIRILYA